MRCKQGDLAIITKSYAGNEGKIVRCVRLAPELGDMATLPDLSITPAVWWEIDRNLQTWGGSQGKFIPDDQLTPLRPPSSEDETTDDQLIDTLA